MNAILKPAAKPPAESVRITPGERVRRQAAIAYGRGSVRLEGFVLSAEGENINRRYIDGELSMEELIDAIKALAPRQPAAAL